MDKLCKKCDCSKQLSDFPKSNRYKDGYDYLCKICRNEVNRVYRANNKQKVKASRKKYYQENLNKMRVEKKNYYSKNKEAKKEYDRIYRVSNKTKIQEYKKNWDIQDRTKIQSKIKRNLRRRLIHVIKKENKSTATMILLGCNIDFFLTYLENKFKINMSWENYGQFGWHIDHIIPCSSFDLTDPTEQAKCFHYTNLQPLWWDENLSKATKIN